MQDNQLDNSINESTIKEKKKKKSKKKSKDNEEYSMIIDDDKQELINNQSDDNLNTPKKKKKKKKKSKDDEAYSMIIDEINKDDLLLDNDDGFNLDESLNDQNNNYEEDDTPKKKSNKRKYEDESYDDFSLINKSDFSRIPLENEEDIFKCLSERDDESVIPEDELNQTKISYTIEPFSCVHHLNKLIKFPLLPIAINQELKVIRQTLIHKWKYKFINEFNGFLYYFENLELIESNATILDDLPFIYYNIKADFYIFRPKVGEFLKAKISCFEDSNRVINCSTNIDLNIIIQLPDEINDKLNKYLKLHQDIIFLIKDINYSKMIIEGTINKKCIKLMEENIEIKETITEEPDHNLDQSNLDDFFAS